MLCETGRRDADKGWHLALAIFLLVCIHPRFDAVAAAAAPPDPTQSHFSLFYQGIPILSSGTILLWDVVCGRRKVMFHSTSLRRKRPRCFELLCDPVDLTGDDPVDLTGDDSPSASVPDCPVCLTALGAEGPAQALGCLHVFCQRCIAQCIRSQLESQLQPDCPVCKRIIPTEEQLVCGVDQPIHHPYTEDASSVDLSALEEEGSTGVDSRAVVELQARLATFSHVPARSVWQSREADSMRLLDRHLYHQREASRGSDRLGIAAPIASHTSHGGRRGGRGGRPRQARASKTSWP